MTILIIPPVVVRQQAGADEDATVLRTSEAPKSYEISDANKQ